MIISCYVIDDEADAVELLKDYIEKTPGLELAGYSRDPLVALNELTGAEAPDITFIDVDMRQLSGLELAGMVNLYTTVVFTTAFPEYALQAFEKEAFDYLLKPITYERFLKCIQHLKRRKKVAANSGRASGADFFMIKSEVKGRMIKVKFDEVIYVEGAVNYIQIHTTNGKHMTYLTMKEITQHLPGQQFVRIHRSFLINISFVRVIERAQVRLETGEALILGDHYKKNFLDLIDEQLVRTDR